MQYTQLGDFIRNKRKNLNISLNTFSFDCGIEPATLSKFENGKSDILFGNLTKIAKGFNQTVAELLTEYENKF